MSEEMRHALQKGYEIEGYRIEKVLGAGGFGITYLAHEIAINRKVAIKEYLPAGIAARGRDDVTVHPLSTGDRENFQWGLDRFRKEAQTLVTFRHNNIVTVYRYFEANGTAFLVMAYEDGESLSKILERAGTLSETEVNEILGPLLSGLEHVHKVGFLHRDIKPGNIYIRRDGSPVLLDFGAARQAMGGRSQSLTSIVSAGYAPFEQYTTRGNQGPWTDIYAFGGVLYRCVTGERPPDSPDRIRNDPYVPAVQAAAGKYSEALLRAIDTALEVDEAKRPQTVAEWRAMLEGKPPEARAPFAAYNQGDTLAVGAGDSARQATGFPSRSASPDTRPPPAKPKRGMLAAAVILGGLVLLGAAGAGAYFYMDSQDKDRVAQIVDQVRTAISNGKWDDAERLIADAEKLRKDVPELDQIKAALKAAREAAEAKTKQAATLIARARQAITLRDYATAEKLLDEAAKLAPDHPDLASARAALKSARDTSGKDEEAHRILVRARDAIRARNFDEAQRLIDEAAKIAPNLAELASVRSELDAAKRASTDTRNLDRLLEEARDLIRRKDYDGAQRKLDEAARISPRDAGLAELRRQLEEARKSTTPPPAKRTPLPSVTRSPMNMCQPGSARFSGATRTLALPGIRYCNSADWNVRNAETDGQKVFWQVIFSDGHVNCECTKTGATEPERNGLTDVPGVSKTPNHLCVTGTQRLVRTTRRLTLPGRRYCTDADWQVRAVKTDGTNLFWDVPFEDGVVSCACRKQ
ncbi:MAG: protein kinase [Rhodospirillaceae bacterium]|nr:protein kinase [Rhodospirillaceae bacterium]